MNKMLISVNKKTNFSAAIVLVCFLCSIASCLTCFDVPAIGAKDGFFTSLDSATLSSPFEQSDQPSLNSITVCHLHCCKPFVFLCIPINKDFITINSINEPSGYDHRPLFSLNIPPPEKPPKNS